MNRFLHYAILVAGLAVVCWVGTGYVGAHPLALAVCLLVAAFYLLGAWELHRFRQATATLVRATADLSAPPASLGNWLDRLHPSLRNAVRLRVEGERVGLPGPALTPYLAGFLVLLGMLGTFLGMVVTLNGTGAALAGATDLESIRESLSTPVKGLGLAFGTSVAGVAASAMLGLVSALCRRDRLQAGQALDTRIATTLRVHSLAHQREESFKLLQLQAQAMPELVGQLQTLMTAMTQQSQALNERLIANQEHFHGKAEVVYGNLASSVGKSLEQSMAESARVAGAVIQPVVEATMAGIARETAALHDGLARTVQQQLDGLSNRFELTTTSVADTWKGALAEHQRTTEALSGEVRASHDQFAKTFEQRSASLVERVGAQLQGTVGSVSDTWGSALAQHQLTAAGVADTWTSALAEHQRSSAALAEEVRASHDRFAQTFEQRSAALVESVGAQLQGTVGSVSDTWGSALAQHQRVSEKLSADSQQALAAAAATIEQHSVSLLRTVDQAHATLQTDMASRDAERLSAWTGALATMATALQTEWQQVGAHNTAQQQQVLDTLARTAGEMSAQSEAHAKNTIAEIAQLLQAASEAPRIAAEVVAELRQKLSDSMARDNTMLEERSRILDTLATLLDAVNHASTEQRAAIDTLVSASADVLERVGSRFTEKADAETEKMAAVAAQITGSAVEVASLGEAFGFAVQLFSDASDKLGTQLQRIEGALGKSATRSDEQLGYYVAQARELIDLSIMSQKQIVEDLQQIASRQATAGSEA